MKTAIKTQLQTNEQTYLQLQGQITFLNAQVKELRTDIINDMQKMGITETENLQLVIQHRTDFDVDALKEILTPQKWNKIKTEIVDRKAYNAAVELKLIDPANLGDGIKISVIEILRRK